MTNIYFTSSLTIVGCLIHGAYTYLLQIEHHSQVSFNPIIINCYITALPLGLNVAKMQFTFDMCSSYSKNIEMHVLSSFMGYEDENIMNCFLD